MCGILGFNWTDKDLAKKMARSLNHRGPDQDGIYADDNITFGHKRLSILDLSEKGRQPMSTENQRYTIVFNGEIFNFHEVKETLQMKGHTFSSSSDTEVLLKGYQEFQESIVEQLNGQFAFVIYDKDKQTLFLARDRIGINPLYYYQNDKKFIFTSEIKAILAAKIPKKIDTEALNHYILFGYTPRTTSILQNVYKLEPAHYAVYDLKTNSLEKTRYWKLNFQTKYDKKEIAQKRLQELLNDSIKKRMIADVPVGAFLSGGVDSSAIVALAAKQIQANDKLQTATKNKLKTFSIKFDYDEFDESKFAQTVADLYKTEHHTIEFTAKDVKELIKTLTFHFDEPFGDASMVPTYLVAKVAKEHVTVSLSGDGGDEVFGGYDFYQRYLVLKKAQILPRWLNKVMYNVVKHISLPNKIKAYFELGTLTAPQKIARLRSYLTKDEFEKLTKSNPEKIYDLYAKDFQKGDPVNELASVEIHNYLSENNQVKVDRASLANSLESRPPLLDHRIVELAVAIDPTLRIKNSMGKYILKKSLEQFLPNNILYRKKQGFATPILHYFRNELKEYCTKYIFEYDKHNFFDKDFMQFLKQQLENNNWKRDYSRIMWSILMFNLWYDRWYLNDD